MLRLGAGAGALLAAGLWPGWAGAADAPQGEDFTFLCVNDLHYFDKNCDRFFQKMVEQMNATGGEDKSAGAAAADRKEGDKEKAAKPAKPDLCLIVGDLAEDGTPAQLGAIRDHLKGLSMPTHIVVGNHDYLNPGPAGDRRAFEELFPRQINYTFEHRGWQVVALDTTEGRLATNTTVPRETLTWLGDNLPKLDKKRPTVLFTHFPLGFFMPARPKNADEVLQPFMDFNLQAVFNGHFHAFTERTRWHATLTTDKCCSFHHANHDGSKEKGYFVCRAKGGKIERTFVEVKVG
jgi:hypothetical protein